LGWDSLAAADYQISALLFRSGRVTEALNVARPAARLSSDRGAYSAGAWVWLVTVVGVWEAQLNHRPEAEEALRMAQRTLEVVAQNYGTSPGQLGSWPELVHDCDRQIKQAFGDVSTVLDLARDALVRINNLNEQDPERLSTLNRLKRRALSDATRAALKLRRFVEAETTARALLSMPLLHGETGDAMCLSQPDDLGWAPVLLAEAEVGLGQSAEALKTIEPGLALYREMQLQGVTHVTFIQHFARALYVQALAEPDGPSGTTNRQEAFAQAFRLLNDLSDEARQLLDTKELLAWIGAEQKKLSAGAAQP